MDRLVFIAATKEKLESYGVNPSTELTDGRWMFHAQLMKYINDPMFSDMYNDPEVKALTPEEYQTLLPKQVSDE